MSLDEKLNFKINSEYYQPEGFIGEGSSHYVFLVRVSAVFPPSFPHKPFFASGKTFDWTLKALKFPKEKCEQLSSRTIAEDPSYDPSSASKRYTRILKKLCNSQKFPGSQNIIKYFDVVDCKLNERQASCLVEEYLTYPINLEDLINLPFNLLESKAEQHIFDELLQGVKFLHKRDIVHRDLHPGNILISRLGRFYYTFNDPQDFDNYAGANSDWFGLHVKITDFELAKEIGSEEQVLSGSRLIQPPEQLPEIQTEIYGVGTLLYRLIKKKYPYPIKQTKNERGFHEVDYSAKVDLEGIPYLLKRIISNALLLKDTSFDTAYDCMDDLIEDYNLAIF